jgi:hypothetical protein
MRSLKPLLGALGALTLSLLPAAAPAAPAAPIAVPGPMDGNWELTLHAKTYPLNGDKPYSEKIPITATMFDTTPIGLSSIGMAGTLNGIPFVLTGYRIGKHYVLFAAGNVVVSLSGDAVVPKTTGVSKTFKGRGQLTSIIAISDFTITGKRV